MCEFDYLLLYLLLMFLIFEHHYLALSFFSESFVSDMVGLGFGDINIDESNEMGVFKTFDNAPVI